jgi:hypothetical protein
MATLSGIRNVVLVVMIALGIPITTHVYLTFFYPESYPAKTAEATHLQDQLNQLMNQEVALSNNPHSPEQQKALEALKIHIQEVSHTIQEINVAWDKEVQDYAAHHTLITFIIIMALSILAIIAGIIVRTALLKTAFTTGGLFLILYGFLGSWSSMPVFAKLVAMSSWFIALIILTIYFYGKE